MKDLSISKKIILLGIVLLIIAGIVVVTLKGVKVSLLFQQHESISFGLGKPIDLKEMNDICKEVFKDKRYVIRGVEYFNEGLNINAESITDEEKNTFIQKVNEKYGTEYTADSITVRTTPNIRVRDLVKPYIKPTLISLALIVVYMIIRFRKISAFKLLGKIFGIIIITEAVIASLIAITRLPLSPTIINLMAVIAVIEMVLYINKQEKEL